MKRSHKFGWLTRCILFGFLLVSCQSNELYKPNNEAGLNGGFETTDSGYPVNWAFFPNPESDDIFRISVDTTKADEGRQSLQLVASQSEKTVGFRSHRVPVQQGKVYSITFAIRNDGCTLKVNRIVQDEFGRDNRSPEIIVETPSPISDWRTFDEMLIASEDDANVVLVFLVDGPGTLWVDDVQVEELMD